MQNKTHITLAVLALSLLQAATGQVFAQVWNPDRENSILNMRSQSVSATSLGYTPFADLNFAVAAYNYEGGEFHRPDRPSGKSELDLSIREIKTFGKVRASGSLTYLNNREFSRNWNSLIGNDPDNPYIICDAVSDNSSTESFSLSGGATWNFAKGWTAAGKIGLLTASLSDTQDPRPKNDISRIPVSLAVEYGFADGWSAGVFGGAELFMSKFTYYLEYGQKAYRYYKMKGMGDFFAFSSSENSSAPREYKGATFTAGLNLGVDKKSFANFTEFAFRSGTENGRDGGSAYEWKSGDYSFTELSLTERFDIKGNLRQSITLGAKLKLTEGYWYDQKQRTDTEHGNITYYEVMSRFLNNSLTRFTADAGYLISKPASWGVRGGVNFHSESFTHYTDGDPRLQSWTLIGVGAEGFKTFELGNHILDISASAQYILPLGDAAFDTGNGFLAKDDITETFVRPIFLYETSAKAKAGIRIDWVLPSISSARLKPAIFAKGGILAGDSKQFLYASAGVYLTF